MTTLRFPTAVDSFDIHAPGEVIRAMHMNDVQSAIGAIQAYCFSLDQLLDAHTNSSTAHSASSITIASFTIASSVDLPSFNWTATTTQQAIEQLKAFADAVATQSAKKTQLTEHTSKDINIAHAGKLLGDKIELGQITEAHLSFQVTTQTELDAHLNDTTNAHPAGAIGVSPTLEGYGTVQTALDGIFTKLTTHQAQDINSAHDGYILGSKIQSGQITENHLSFQVATQTKLDAHTTLTQNVHGVVGEVVGTLNNQIIENKTLISTNKDTKIALFTDAVDEIEKQLFIPGYNNTNSQQATDKQLTIRAPSATQVTQAAISSTTVQVVSTSLFANGDTVTFYYPSPTYANSVTRTVASVVDGYNLSLSGDTVSIPLGSAAVNTSIPNPLFEVTAQGNTTIQNLTIKNSSFQDITFNDNLVVDGSLQVESNATIGGTTTLSGATTIQNTLTVQDSVIVASSLVSGALTATDITGSGNLSISGSSLLTGNVTTTNDLSIGGDLIVSNGGTFAGTVTAEQFNADTYNGVNLSGFYDTFLAHKDQATNAHQSTSVSYSSFERIDSSLPENFPGLTLQATIQANPNISDGYILVDRANLFKIGDVVSLGQDNSGIPTFYPSTVTDIEHSTYTPEYFQSLKLSGTPTSLIPYSKIYLSSIPSGLLVSNNARIIRKPINLKETTDTLAINLNDHSKSLIRAHRSDAITTAPFNFSSPLYAPTINNVGDITVHAVLNELGKDLYRHLDNIYDGFEFPHEAKDVAFSNVLTNIGRKVSLTQNAQVGATNISVANSSSLSSGNTIQVRSTTTPTQTVTIINIVANVVYFTPALTSQYNVVDNAYVLDFNLQTVQDAIEALSSSYDLTSHVDDTLDAHQASAIKFDNSALTLGANVQAAIENLKDYVDESSTALDGYLNTHLNDSADAHDAGAISFDPSYNSNLAGTTTIQSAIEVWNLGQDIPETEFPFEDGQLTPSNVTGLLFDPTKVRSATIHYSIYRYYSGSEVEIATVGTLRVVYKTQAGMWLLDDTYGGDSPGVSLLIHPSGQVQYTSTAIGGTSVANRLRFRATVTTLNTTDGF